MLAAPELVVPEMVEVGGQLEVALELQRRVLTQRVVWCKKGAEPHLPRLEIEPPAAPAQRRPRRAMSDEPPGSAHLSSRPPSPPCDER